MTKSEKAEIISRLTEEFSSSEAIVVSDFKGLTVHNLEELRDLARQSDVKVMVVKNTLASIALNNSNKSGMTIKGTNVFLWGKEQLNVCKVCAKYAEKHELFNIKTSFIDGEVASVEKVVALSKLPSKDELLAMLLQVWNAPIRNFTIGLGALRDKKSSL